MNRRQFLNSAALISTGCLASCRLPENFRSDTKGPIPSPARPARGQKTPPAMLPSGFRLTYTSCAVAENCMAMTFDDGPHAELTPHLLDLLKEWGLKATFFLVGQNALAYPQIVKRTVEEGHEVGNHSWNHPKLSSMSDVLVRSQLRRTHDAITAACGTAPTIFRPPYGAITARQKQWIGAEFGYPTILWSVDTNDWKDRVSSIVSGRILEGARSGSIVLAHDIHRTSVEAMPATLPALRDRGMKFLTVSQLMAMEAGKTPPPAAAPAAEPAQLFSPGSF